MLMLEKSFGNRNKTNLFVILIFAVAILIRFWHLDKVPVSLFGDELDVGNQANSILQVGKDYMGNSFPIYFQSFVEYRLPMQLYAAVPTIFLFGLNEWGVRLPAAIFGVISLFGFYLLIKEMIDKKVAIIGLILLAISPWHFMYSRQANDAGMLPPLIIFGTLFFLKGRKKYKHLLLSAVLFTLTLYSYATSTVFVPIYVLSLIYIYRKDIFSYSTKKLMVIVLLCVVLAAPFALETVRGSTTARFSHIGVMSDEKVAEIVQSNRKWSNSRLAKTFYNSRSVVLNEILRNYISSFSVTYLFLDGDPNLRQSIGSFGELYMFDLLFLAVGVWVLVTEYSSYSEERKKSVQIIAFWILLAPFASALTEGGGHHASRLLVMVFPLIIISSIGVIRVYQSIVRRKHYVLGFVLSILIIINVAYHFQRYFIIWPGNSWRFWHYGFEQALVYAKENDGDYKQVFINNTYEPMLPRFLFWYDYDMDMFHDQFTDDKHIDSIVEGYNGFQLGDKYYFGELADISEEFVNSERLIVASAEREISNPRIMYDPRIKLLRTIKSPNGIPIFYIFTGTEKPDMNE